MSEVSPLNWYDISTRAQARLPFADYYEVDPSENPTVRPAKTEPALVRAPVIPVPGERGLYIVGVQWNPHLG